MTPLFSICHTTARPDLWRKAYDAWLGETLNPENVEYVLVVDHRWGFTELPTLRPQDKVLWNTGPKCLVGGANIACAASTGHVLIINSDDIFPQVEWDLELSDVIQCWHTDFVIETRSNTPADARRLMVCQILSRARYNRLGYGLFPGYDGMYADDDFSEHARQDGVVIDARHITIEHCHPAFDPNVKMDAVYAHENRAQAYEMGRALLERRRAERFQS